MSLSLAESMEGLTLWSAKNSRGNFYGHAVKVTGECEVVYRPDKPLSCGAHVWIQTTGTVEVDGKAINKKERD